MGIYKGYLWDTNEDLYGILYVYNMHITLWLFNVAKSKIPIFNR